MAIGTLGVCSAGATLLPLSDLMIPSGVLITFVRNRRLPQELLYMGPRVMLEEADFSRVVALTIELGTESKTVLTSDDFL